MEAISIYMGAKEPGLYRKPFLSSSATAGLTKLKVESLKVSTLVAIVRPFFLSSTATAGLTIDLGGVTSLHTSYILVWFGWLVVFPLL